MYRKSEEAEQGAHTKLGKSGDLTEEQDQGHDCSIEGKSNKLKEQ
jgi:hypothetical protein